MPRRPRRVRRRAARVWWAQLSDAGSVGGSGLPRRSRGRHLGGDGPCSVAVGDVPEHVLDASGDLGAAASIEQAPGLIWASTTCPARVAAIRRAFSNWSAKSGTITSGTPAANAASAVPEPPWHTTRVGMVEHPCLVDPGLHVDVCRDRPQRRCVKAAAHGQQDPCARSLDRLQRHAVGLGGDRHVAQDRAEGQVDQRRVQPRHQSGSETGVSGGSENGPCPRRVTGRATPGSASGRAEPAARNQALAVLLQCGGRGGDRAGLRLGQ